MSLKIVVTKESSSEQRVALVPDALKRLERLPLEVTIESGLGLGVSIDDEAYAAKGCRVVDDITQARAQADVILCVRRPRPDLAPPRSGQALIGLLNPWAEPTALERLARGGGHLFSLELLPRISRAQAMDALSSQASLSGYRAVIDGSALLERSLPLMMTAAGKLSPARVMVIGAGVAGLQAIATARRLGAVVCATDVRPASKEEVQSLGATFIAVEDEEFLLAQTASGYAKPMSAAYQDKQRALMRKELKSVDMVITAAAIPGRPAPLLLDDSLLESLPSGAVVIDLAADQGGNVSGGQRGRKVKKGKVTIFAPSNPAGRVARDASLFYANNLANFLALLRNDSGDLALDTQDDILTATLLAHDGRVRAEFAPKPSSSKAAPKVQASADQGRSAEAAESAAGSAALSTKPSRRAVTAAVTAKEAPKVAASPAARPLAPDTKDEE